MDRAKSYADVNRSFREFEEGEKVFLKVPSHSKSLISGECAKLSPRYWGPWLMLKRIGAKREGILCSSRDDMTSDTLVGILPRGLIM